MNWLTMNKYPKMAMIAAMIVSMYTVSLGSCIVLKIGRDWGQALARATTRPLAIASVGLLQPALAYSIAYI